LRLAHGARVDVVRRVGALRDRLVQGLLTAVPGIVETVAPAAKVAGSAHVCIEGVESEALLYLLERGGVCASAGSSCASGALEMSHVLAAMGISTEAATGAIRFSLGEASSDADVDQVLEVLPPAVARLRC
jgi:cysteine desulfurase